MQWFCSTTRRNSSQSGKKWNKSSTTRRNSSQSGKKWNKHYNATWGLWVNMKSLINWAVLWLCFLFSTRYVLALFWDETMQNHYKQDSEYKVTEAAFHAQPVFFLRDYLKTIFKFKIVHKSLLRFTIKPTLADL